jgi:hypothetical protein
VSEFEQWAVDVGYAIGMRLGAPNVVEEIGSDQATWRFGTNSVTAKLRSADGLAIDLTFARGGAALKVAYLRTSPRLISAQIAGILADA